MRCVGHVACMAKSRGVYVVLVGKPASCKRPLGRPRHRSVRILLKWVFKEKDGKWTGLIRLRIRTSVGVCKSCYKFSFPSECGNLLTSWRGLASQEGHCSISLLAIVEAIKLLITKFFPLASRFLSRKFRQDCNDAKSILLYHSVRLLAPLQLVFQGRCTDGALT